MALVDHRQFDLFDSTRGFSNVPPPRRRARPIATMAEVAYRRDVRRLSDFRLENTHFCLLTRPWFWPHELMEKRTLERELARRRAQERRFAIGAPS